MDLTAAELTEEDLALRAMIRSLVSKEIAPRAADIDRDGTFPSHAMTALAEVGLLGLLVPEEYGGAGGTALQYVLVVEEIARACGSTAATYMTQAHGGLPIRHGGDTRQRAQWLPLLASGEAVGAIAFTEPHAGSDLAALTTTARRNGDGYVLDGRKMFTTNGGHADLICVLARTGATERSRGLSAFVLARDSAGVTTSAPFEKMGIRGSETVELVLDNVAVPAGNLLGHEGDGHSIAMATLDGARLSTAAQALGLAQGAYDIALRYALEREQFGQRIFEFQAVQFRLVDMAVAIESARALLHQVTRAVDGDPTARYSREAAMVKVYCSDVAMQVTTDAVQTLGGYGFMREYQVERYMRDAKITQIYDGTNDINRLVIGRELAHRSHN